MSILADPDPNYEPPENAPYPDAMRQFPRVRQSALSTFDACGLQSRFDLEHRQGWSSKEAALGTIVHATLAMCLETMRDTQSRKIPESEALAHYAEAIRQHDIDRVCAKCGCPVVPVRDSGLPRVACLMGHTAPSSLMTIPMEQIRDGWWQVGKWARDQEFDIEHLVDIEMRLDATLRYPDGRGGSVERQFTGQLDAVFVDPHDASHAIVVDWKTGRAIPGPSAISHTGYFQQRAYAFLLFENFPRSVQRVTLAENYTRHSDTRETTLWREGIEDVRDELEALIERFDRAWHDQTFSPQPGTHCSYCPTPQRCAIPRLVRGPGRIESEAQALTVARQLLVASAVEKQAKESLAVWTAGHGPIEVKDQKSTVLWGQKMGTRRAKPEPDKIQAEIAAAAAEGREPDIEGLYKTSASSRFSTYKPNTPGLTMEPGPNHQVTDEQMLLFLSDSTTKDTK